MALDRAVKGEIAEQSFAQTHHGYANDILDHLTVDGCAPVGYEGELWVVNSDSALWEKMPNDHILRLVAERHDGCDYCTRATD